MHKLSSDITLFTYLVLYYYFNFCHLIHDMYQQHQQHQTRKNRREHDVENGVGRQQEKI